MPIQCSPSSKKPLLKQHVKPFHRAVMNPDSIQNTNNSDIYDNLRQRYSPDGGKLLTRAALFLKVEGIAVRSAARPIRQVRSAIKTFDQANEQPGGWAKIPTQAHGKCLNPCFSANHHDLYFLYRELISGRLVRNRSSSNDGSDLVVHDCRAVKHNASFLTMTHHAKSNRQNQGTGR